LAGLIADASTLRIAMAAPVVCYVVIALFGRYCRRSVV
jgi:FHS family L-fucose permease-like MFS transporter